MYILSASLSQLSKAFLILANYIPFFVSGLLRGGGLNGHKGVGERGVYGVRNRRERKGRKKRKVELNIFLDILSSSFLPLLLK